MAEPFTMAGPRRVLTASPWDSLFLNDFSATERIYFTIFLPRFIFTFGGIGFVLLPGYLTPAALLAVSLALAALEGLAAYKSRTATSHAPKRAWIVANLALYLCVVCALAAAILIPGKARGWMETPHRGRDDDFFPGEPWPSLPKTGSGGRLGRDSSETVVIRWFSRMPAVVALLCTVAAGFTMPSARIRHWGITFGHDADTFPGVIVLGPQALEEGGVGDIGGDFLVDAPPRGPGTEPQATGDDGALAGIFSSQQQARGSQREDRGRDSLI